MKVTVFVPGAAFAGAGHDVFLVFGAVVVEGAPDAGFVALVVVLALAEDLAVGMPPGPCADVDAVVAESAFDVGLVGVCGVGLFVMDLSREGRSQENGG